MSASRPLDLHARLGAVLLLTAVALTAGCGKGAKVTLQAQFNPAQPAGATGDDTTDDDSWTDTNPLTTTPGFAMAIQSAKLTGPDVSHTIFDRGADTADALFVRLYNSPTVVILPPDNNDDLGPGTYDTLELKVVFYETAIAVADATNTTHIRRLRTYFQDYLEPLIGVSPTPTVTAEDQLISDGTKPDGITPEDFEIPTSGDLAEVGSTDKNMRWINPDSGVRCAKRSDCDDSGNPYQADMTHFPADYPTVKIGVPDIVVDSSTESNFIITFTAKIQNIFFWDETDATSPANTLFNYLNASSNDGKIRAACTVTTPVCTGTQKEADFGIGPPNFAVTKTEL